MTETLPKYYAGIGTRGDTVKGKVVNPVPQDVLQLAARAAVALAAEGFTLRSGHANGMDQAFEAGAASVDGPAEIFLPWDSFGDARRVHGLKLEEPTEAAFALAKETHPRWGSLKQGGQKLHARNGHQILGEELDSPVAFVLAYTMTGRDEGGTGQAIRIARKRGIPVFNLHEPKTRARIEKLVKAHKVPEDVPYAMPLAAGDVDAPADDVEALDALLAS